MMHREGPRGARTLKRRQGVSFVVLNVKQLVQLRDGERLVNLRTDVAQLELRPVRFGLLVQGNQLAQGRAGEKLDGGKIQYDLFLLVPLHQIEQFLAEFLDIRFVENLSVKKMNHRRPAYFRDPQSLRFSHQPDSSPGAPLLVHWSRRRSRP